VSNQLIYNYLIIEGNIGAGKTSLAHSLSEHFNTRLILERFEENSFLPMFYADPQRYAFPLEMSFLADRYQQLKEELFRTDLFKQGLISDYIVDKSLIFARKTLNQDEYSLYKKLFEIVHSFLPKPDLLVYLRCSTASLLRNIQKRGRDYEQEIQADYLQKIQDSYMDFIRSKPEARIVVIDSDDLDFVGSEQDLQWITEVINRPYPQGLNYVMPENRAREHGLFAV
jgi:deoxyguanosine kinase